MFVTTMRDLAFAPDKKLESMRYVLSFVEIACVDIRLPEGCNPKSATIVIMKEGEGYRLDVEDEVTALTADTRLNSILNSGSCCFTSFQDMVSFFRSLRPLFKDEDNVVEEGIEENNNSEINRNRLLIYDDIAKTESVNEMKIRKKPLVYVTLGGSYDERYSFANDLAAYLSTEIKHHGFIEIGVDKFSKLNNTRYFDVEYKFNTDNQLIDLAFVRDNNTHAVVLANGVEAVDGAVLEELCHCASTGFLWIPEFADPVSLGDCIFIFAFRTSVNRDKYRYGDAVTRLSLCKAAVGNKLNKELKVTDYIPFFD